MCDSTCERALDDMYVCIYYILCVCVCVCVCLYLHTRGDERLYFYVQVELGANVYRFLICMNV